MYKHILLAVDDTDASALALKEAIKFAKNQKAKLYIVHIVDTLYEGEADRETFVDLTKKEGQKLLNTITKKLGRTIIEFELKLSELTPSKSGIAEKIVHEAELCTANLIMMGTHGHSRLNHILSGSLVEEVIRIAKIPILIVRG